MLHPHHHASRGPAPPRSAGEETAGALILPASRGRWRGYHAKSLNPEAIALIHRGTALSGGAPLDYPMSS